MNEGLPVWNPRKLESLCTKRLSGFAHNLGMQILMPTPVDFLFYEALSLLFAFLSIPHCHEYDTSWTVFFIFSFSLSWVHTSS